MATVKTNTWDEFKLLITTFSLSIQFIENGDHYFLVARKNDINFEHVIRKTTPRSSDQVDFEDNFKSNGNLHDSFFGMINVLNDQLQTSDTLNNGGLDTVISVISGTPVELKVGATKKPKRKAVVLQPLDNGFSFGFSATTQNILIFKEQMVFLPVGEGTEIWLDVDTGTRNIAIGEVS